MGQNGGGGGGLSENANKNGHENANACRQTREYAFGSTSARAAAVQRVARSGREAHEQKLKDQRLVARACRCVCVCVCVRIVTQSARRLSRANQQILYGPKAMSALERTGVLLEWGERARVAEWSSSGDGAIGRRKNRL